MKTLNLNPPVSAFHRRYYPLAKVCLLWLPYLNEISVDIEFSVGFEFDGEYGQRRSTFLAMSAEGFKCPNLLDRDSRKLAVLPSSSKKPKTEANEKKKDKKGKKAKKPLAAETELPIRIARRAIEVVSPPYGLSDKPAILKADANADVIKLQNLLDDETHQKQQLEEEVMLLQSRLSELSFGSGQKFANEESSGTSVEVEVVNGGSNGPSITEEVGTASSSSNSLH
ncbi:hypothetical protein L1887_06763 [Cichorium endivia]|nr:hypothetical protein L1887_06763 [Cichorium endivia]